jgi:hypothetical protein
MALSFSVDNLDGINEAFRGLYEEKDGKFQLSVDGIPKEKESNQQDYTKLMESVAKLEANNNSLLKEKLDAKRLAEQATLEAAKKNGDLQAIEDSWAAKYNDLETNSKTSTDGLQSVINNLTIGSESSRIASELALPGSAEVLLPHIKSRLSVEIVNGQPVTRVLDKDGKPSALSIKELTEEIRMTPAFAPIITGVKSNGAGGDSGSTGSPGQKTMKLSEFNKLNPMAKSEFVVKNGGKVID